MKPSIVLIKDTPWYGISWKSLNDIVSNNTINYIHTEVRSDIMNRSNFLRNAVYTKSLLLAHGYVKEKLYEVD